jgi:hypothetical protein
VADTVNADSQRITRLEELARKLDTMPEDMAMVKAVLGRVEVKLDDHMKENHAR